MEEKKNGEQKSTYLKATTLGGSKREEASESLTSCFFIERSYNQWVNHSPLDLIFGLSDRSLGCVKLRSGTIEGSSVSCVL